MQAKAYENAKGWWNHAISIFGSAAIGEMPKIVMNNRLTSTAGRAWLDQDKIDLSVYLMTRNEETFYREIIPHEICHFIAWRLYGDYGHRVGWKRTMQEMGLNPERCHNMITLNQRKRAGL